ncbi:MAG: hypothetical protein AAF329_00880 [Cyanobacteria bacterium P01_A01_bin.17]
MFRVVVARSFGCLLAAVDRANFASLVTGRPLHGLKTCKGDQVFRFVLLSSPHTLAMGLLVKAIHDNPLIKGYANTRNPVSKSSCVLMSIHRTDC